MTKRTFDATVIVVVLTLAVVGAWKMEAQLRVQNGTSGPGGTLAGAVATLL